MKAHATSLVSIAAPIISRGIPIFPGGPMIPVMIPKMNLKKKHIILWVPGTNDHLIPAKFLEAVKQMFGDDAEVVLCDYPATREYHTSRSVGEATLKATLDFLRANKGKGTKVYVAGLSQGAMAATAVISQPDYMGLIERAVFMGHPGISNHHFDNHSKVKEFNNFLDPVTFDWGADKDDIVMRVEKFLKGDIFAGISLLKTGLTHPLEAIWFGLLYLHRVPLLSFPKILPTDPHDYTDKMDDAASWLYVGNLS